MAARTTIAVIFLLLLVSNIEVSMSQRMPITARIHARMLQRIRGTTPQSSEPLTASSFAAVNAGGGTPPPGKPGIVGGATAPAPTGRTPLASPESVQKVLNFLAKFIVDAQFTRLLYMGGIQRVLTQAMRISPAVTMVLPNPDTTMNDLPPGSPWLANTTIAEQLLKFHMILGGKVNYYDMNNSTPNTQYETMLKEDIIKSPESTLLNVVLQNQSGRNKGAIVAPNVFTGSFVLIHFIDHVLFPETLLPPAPLTPTPSPPAAATPPASPATMPGNTNPLPGSNGGMPGAGNPNSATPSAPVDPKTGLPLTPVVPTVPQAPPVPQTPASTPNANAYAAGEGEGAR